METAVEARHDPQPRLAVILTNILYDNRRFPIDVGHPLERQPRAAMFLAFFAGSNVMAICSETIYAVAKT
jgi:hypothetical protein